MSENGLILVGYAYRLHSIHAPRAKLDDDGAAAIMDVCASGSTRVVGFKGFWRRAELRAECIFITLIYARTESPAPFVVTHSRPGSVPRIEKKLSDATKMVNAVRQ